MSLSSLPFDPTIFTAAVITASAMYQAGFMGVQFQGSALSAPPSASLNERPPAAIGMRRAQAFQERLSQRPRFTTPNCHYIS